jgi:hypothetical protein
MKIVRIKLGPEQRLGVLENHKVTLLPDRKLGSGRGFLLLIRQAQKTNEYQVYHSPDPMKWVKE